MSRLSSPYLSVARAICFSERSNRSPRANRKPVVAPFAGVVIRTADVNSRGTTRSLTRAVVDAASGLLRRAVTIDRFAAARGATLPPVAFDFEIFVPFIYRARGGRRREAE